MRDIAWRYHLTRLDVQSAPYRFRGGFGFPEQRLAESDGAATGREGGGDLGRHTALQIVAAEDCAAIHDLDARGRLGGEQIADARGGGGLGHASGIESTRDGGNRDGLAD